MKKIVRYPLGMMLATAMIVLWGFSPAWAANPSDNAKDKKSGGGTGGGSITRAAATTPSAAGTSVPRIEKPLALTNTKPSVAATPRSAVPTAGGGATLVRPGRPASGGTNTAAIARSPRTVTANVGAPAIARVNRPERSQASRPENPNANRR